VYNDAIHDVLYTLHKVHPISDEALSNDFERRCKRISACLRWVLAACFVAILLMSAWPLLPWAAPIFPFKAVNCLMLLLVFSGASYIVVDAWPMARDLSRFDTHAYQQRQLVAAHDLANAATLAHFTLPGLTLTEKWLGLRIERSRLRLGILLGGSDKFAVLAVISGAWAIWHNLPSGSSLIEQSLYWSLGAFIGASGFGGILPNASIARMAYQRDILSLAICQHSQVAGASL